MSVKSINLDGFDEKQGARATGQDYCRICAKDPKRSFGRCKYLLCSESDAKRWMEMYNLLEHEVSTDAKELAKRYLAKWEDYYEHRRARVPVMTVRKHAGHELGAREFTLTYSNKWFDDGTARTLMIRAIQRLARYYNSQIEEFIAVGETGTRGQSHIHAYYLLKGGKKMTDKNFKRAWEHWNPKRKLGAGFEGGHHALVQDEADFKGYIDKEKNLWFEYNHKNVEDEPEEQGEEGSEEGSEASDEECL